jgi:hypothetical protein
MFTQGQLKLKWNKELEKNVHSRSTKTKMNKELEKNVHSRSTKTKMKQGVGKRTAYATTHIRLLALTWPRDKLLQIFYRSLHVNRVTRSL